MPLKYILFCPPLANAGWSLAEEDKFLQVKVQSLASAAKRILGSSSWDRPFSVLDSGELAPDRAASAEIDSLNIRHLPICTYSTQV